MPKAKSAKSLLELCLQSVCQLVRNCTGEDQVEMTSTLSGVVEEENESASKCVANPFEALHSTLLEQVIDVCGLKNIKQINLLTTKQTTKLDLSNVYLRNKHEIDYVLQLAASLCLRYLQFPEMLSQTTNPLEYIQKFLPQFQHLQVLEVFGSGESFDDSCLHLLGIYCIDLRELDISYCNVTDDGIEQLCGGTTVQEEEKLKRLSHGQCKSIQELSIYDTKITVKGVQMALLHLPDLKTLKSSLVFEALMATHQNESLICAKYALRQLVLEDLNLSPPYLYQNGDLRLAASCCPFVTHLDIQVDVGVTDSDLLGLAVLEGLRHLKLSKYIDLVRITFDGGLAPLLQARGHSLKTLELAFLTKSVPVHLGTVVECCRNLKRLAFRCIYFTPACIEEGEGEEGRPSKRTKSDFLLNHLEELYLIDTGDGQLRRQHIKELLLLSAPTLKKLTFVYCDDLDDDTLRQVFELSSFQNLEELAVGFCNSITKDGINLFLNGENALNYLEICECDFISGDDDANWADQAEKNNWDLEFGFDEVIDEWF